ncbi:hypothetical protein N9Y42_01790 [Mariniblastus sp.]|nr:hypothetical protein [Mariniblastus sp.]
MDLESANLFGGNVDGEIHINICDGTPSIYGDAKGLKCLAMKLLALAELDQSNTTSSQLPDGEGFHVHLNCKLSRAKSSQNLVIGRIDSKGDGSIDWYADEVLQTGKD